MQNIITIARTYVIVSIFAVGITDNNPSNKNVTQVNAKIPIPKIEYFLVFTSL